MSSSRFGEYYWRNNVVKRCSDSQIRTPQDSYFLITNNIFMQTGSTSKNNYYDKYSLCLLFIHWLDCARDSITVENIFKEQERDFHKVGRGVDVELTHEDIEEILEGLVAFSHLIKQPDSTYSIKPLGAILRNADSSTVEYLRDFFYGKIPVGGEVQRRFQS